MTKNVPKTGEDGDRGYKNNPKKSISLNISQTEVTVTSSALPPSAELRELEKICPGSARIIIGNAVEQSEHRRDLERVVINSNCKHEAQGQWMAFLIALGLIALAGMFLHYGYPAYAITIVTGTLGSLLSVNFYGKRKARKEVDDKRKSEDPLKKDRGNVRAKEVNGDMIIESGISKEEEPLAETR